MVTQGSDNNGAVSICEIIDPTTTNLGVPTANMSATRGKGGLVTLPNGTVMAFGNTSDPGTEIFTESTELWTTGSPMLVNRFGNIGYGWLSSGKLIVIGGDGAGTCELFDPSV